MKEHFSPNHQPFRLRRDPLIDMEQAERVHNLAKQILAEIGIEVKQPEYQAKLRAAGIRVTGDRAFFDARCVDEYVDEVRRDLLASRGEPAGPDDDQITLSISSYPLYVHDLETDSVVPYTTERLIEMTKFLDSLAGENVAGAPPGIPVDVHPHLQPVAQYRIAALYARQGATPCDPTSAQTVRHLLDMADVMGSPIHSLPVYMPTPLRLGGESLDAVLACLDRIDSIRVGSMPLAGASAPLHPFGALAMAAAEVIGGAIAVKVLTGKPVTFHPNIFPADLREGAMVFGSPENMLFQMLVPDFNRYYGWVGGDGAPDNVHVMAKLPGGQSAAEKAAIMAVGAALGARWFSGAGALSLDEIFSAEQLLLDCEIRDWVQRAVRGVWMGEEAAADWLEEIRGGLENGFIAQDSTLNHYRTHTWYPRRFARGAIGPWLEKGRPRLSAKLRAEVQRRIAAHNYRLDDDRAREIERIYAAAVKAVGK